MAFRLKFSGRAVREVGEAHEWYEAQSEGLGLEYEAALELQLRRLEQAPLLYAQAHSAPVSCCLSASGSASSSAWSQRVLPDTALKRTLHDRTLHAMA
jgi:hypothetical protein